MCSGITRNRVLNWELYAEISEVVLIYLHLFTACFMKISPQSSEQMQFWTKLFPITEEKSSWNSLKINADKTASEIFVPPYLNI